MFDDTIFFYIPKVLGNNWFSTNIWPTVDESLERLSHML